ncbi:MAG: hypothetical protein PHW76_09940 [Alphaproteobacteria bacterium]|nr:hypothetical protein [Alphaproteobacteria bacterium]
MPSTPKSSKTEPVVGISRLFVNAAVALLKRFPEARQKLAEGFEPIYQLINEHGSPALKKAAKITMEILSAATEDVAPAPKKEFVAEQKAEGRKATRGHFTFTRKRDSPGVA